MKKMSENEMNTFKTLLEIKTDGNGDVTNIKSNYSGFNKQRFKEFKKEEFVKFFKEEMCHFDKSKFRTDIFNFCFSDSFHDNKDLLFFISDKYTCKNPHNIICLNQLTIDEMNGFLSSIFQKGYILRCYKQGK